MITSSKVRSGHRVRHERTHEKARDGGVAVGEVDVRLAGRRLAPVLAAGLVASSLIGRRLETQALEARIAHLPQVERGHGVDADAEDVVGVDLEEGQHVTDATWATSIR